MNNQDAPRIPSLVALGGGHGLSATLGAGRLVADHVTAWRPRSATPASISI